MVKKKNHIFHTLCSDQHSGSFTRQGESFILENFYICRTKTTQIFIFFSLHFSSIFLYCKLYWRGFIFWYLCFFFPSFIFAPHYITSKKKKQNVHVPFQFWAAVAVTTRSSWTQQPHLFPSALHNPPSARCDRKRKTTDLKGPVLLIHFQRHWLVHFQWRNLHI